MEPQNKGRKALILILALLKTSAEVGNAICSCLLGTLSAKNPFKNHIIGNITDYFSHSPNLDNIEFNWACDNISLKHYSFRRNSIEINKNITIINNNLFFRRLVSDSFCSDMYLSLMNNKGRQLSHVFQLNYEKIRYLSIVTAFVYSAYILFFLDQEELFNCLKTGFKGGVLLFFLWISKFILFFILIYFIENGDIGKYDDFLECNNVKKDFFKQFTDVNKFRKIFFAFTILNIISEVLDKLKEFFEICENSPTKPNTNNNQMEIGNINLNKNRF